MPPEIRYCTTGDGKRIAYAASGTGPPLVYCSAPSSHVQKEWELPRWRGLYERLSKHCTLVRYDHRGFGLSDRDVERFDLSALVSDLEAVVERLRAGPIALLSPDTSTMPIAVGFAARHPEQVTRLVLTTAYPRATPEMRAFNERVVAMASATPDWDFASRAATRGFEGWDEEWWSRQYAALLHASTTPGTFARYFEWLNGFDVTDAIPRITSPTLLIQDRGDECLSEEGSREFASLLPDGRLVMVDPLRHKEWGTTWLRTATEFLLGTAVSDEDAVTVARAAAVVLFADIVDSTALTERMGDTAFRERARALDPSLRAIISGAGGQAIDGKLLGDGVLATFPAAAQAIDAARLCGAAGNEGGLPLHLGIHAGDVIREDNNVYGGAVNIAARISALSAPGEVLVSDIVRGLARTSAGVVFEDRGEFELKGVGESVRIYAVHAPKADR